MLCLKVFIFVCICSKNTTLVLNKQYLKSYGCVRRGEFGSKSGSFAMNEKRFNF